MPGVYGGDEINALVIDAGQSATRAGWAGEDTPRVVLPSSYAYLPLSDDDIAALQADAAYAPASATTATTAAGDGDGDGDHLMEEAHGTATLANGATTEASDERMRASKARSAANVLRFHVDRDHKRRRYVGDNDVNLYRAGAEIASVFDADGIVSDVGGFTSVCQYALDQLACRPAEHPLLLTEPAWNTRECREQLTELAFESFDAPAFYLANRTVLSSFAAGKPTSLVIDLGSSTVSTIPIVDGFVLRKGIQRQDNAGDAINRALLYSLHRRTTPFAGVMPQYLVKSRTAVDPGASANVVLRQDRLAGSTDSFRTYQVARTLNDFKESVAQVLEMPWNDQQAQYRAGRMYEFPDGYNDAFGLERLRAPELLFTPQLWTGAEGVLTPERAYTGLADMALASIHAVDVDIRPALFANIVVVGGTSFIPGLVDRLSYELALRAANQKIKIHSPGNPTERRHAPWLGASILASLGSFHQLWISRQEYDEHGPAIVHARCK
jgi:actin-related protein